MNDKQELLPPDAIDPPVQPHEVRQSGTNAAEGTDLLGIMSIILPFLGLAIVGIFVALFAYRRAKDTGRSTTVAKVGIAVNIASFAFALFMIWFIFSAIF